MAVKIRLMRIGAKKRPFYRVVAVDERQKRTGKYIELLGTYNPLTEPKEIILKQERIDWWRKNGAVLSDGYLRIIKEAPQKLPRKPKKEKAVKPTEAPAPQAETQGAPAGESGTTEESTSNTPPENVEPTQAPEAAKENAAETPAEPEAEEK